LIALAGETMRVATAGKDEGVLWHRVSVPKALDRVLVLDASYPIRQLCQLDPTVTPADRHSDTEVKRFDNVTIYQLHSFSGRHSVEQSFRERRKEDRAISREVVEVVKGIPAEESCLIFTFKKKQELDIRQILLNDLLAAGVDVEATMPNGKPRINVLTWGDETSLNDYAHCENVILAGVLHRSLLDIAAAAVGQLDDRKAKLEVGRLNELLESEIGHSIFQAISRGKCREIDRGQAKPMKAWVIHPRPLQRLLEPVLPGAQWRTWVPVHGGVCGSSEVAQLAARMSDYLKTLPATAERMPTKQIREVLGVPAEAARTFQRAVERLLDLSAGDWEKQGQALVRVCLFPAAEAA
jgi:hypothetical protein